MAMHSHITAAIAGATPIIPAELLDSVVKLQVAAEQIEAVAEAVALQLDDMQRVAREAGHTAFTGQACRVSSSLLELLCDKARHVGSTCHALEIARVRPPSLAA